LKWEVGSTHIDREGLILEKIFYKLGQGFTWNVRIKEKKDLVCIDKTFYLWGVVGGLRIIKFLYIHSL